ncbi:UBX domain-containing protein 7-like isoform X2 [Brevipalpus obovatus]|uniref:UBX domain-containing protein 7-like isoform X2 n=1 Tax=Brevipalpus obovatus TaxID=246614 RepID=UPI003D9E2825
MSEATPSAASDVDEERNAIEQFCNFTGASDERARATLEACNWNIELAINMHVDGIDTSDPVDVIPTAGTTTNDLGSTIAEDSSSQDVRPPIPPVRQVLVEDGFVSHRPRNSPHSVFDAFRNFRAEARWLEQGESSTENSNFSKRRTLEELFRPPLDLLFRGTMDNAREYAAQNNKWLMVNLQNVQEFACQVLNRDLWSNPAVKEIVSEHFVFWQIYHDSYEGTKYMQFYSVEQFPYIAILDPRTGEKMRSWSNGTLDPVTFCDIITEFLLLHPSPDGSTQLKTQSPTSLSKKKPYEESEEIQLRAAIAASLEENHKVSADSSSRNRSNNVGHETDSDDVSIDSFDSDTGAAVWKIKATEETKNESGVSSINNHASSSIGASSSSSSNSKASTSWESYLPSNSSKNVDMLIRYPDGKREKKSFPAEAPLKVLLLYISSKGFSMDEYEVVTCFPKINLNELREEQTLEASGLFPANTVFVHLKT